MYNNGDNWPIGEVEVFLALWDGARIKSTRHEKLSYFTFASASWIQAEWPSHQMSPAQLVGELDSPDVHPNHWWAPPEEWTWDSGPSGPEILLELWVFPLRLEKSQIQTSTDPKIHRARLRRWCKFKQHHCYSEEGLGKPQDEAVPAVQNEPVQLYFFPTSRGKGRQAYLTYYTIKT